MDKEELQVLRQLTEKLNSLDDSLAERIIQIEIELRKFVTISIELKVDDVILVYGKFDGKWCLIINKHDSAISLLSAPRHLRDR